MSLDSQYVQDMTTRNVVFRKYYQRVLLAVNAMIVSAFVLAAILVVVSLPNRKPNYFANTTSGVVVPIHALSEPILSTDYILQWASLAVRQSYNLNFVSVEKQLNDIRSYFTPAGLTSFLNALDGSSLVRTIQANKLIVSAVVSGTPMVTARGLVYGRFMWRVELPVVVTFTSASETKHKKMIVNMLITRVPALDAPQGIQIDSMLTTAG